MAEIKSRRLMSVRDKGGRMVNIGAGVDERHQVVVITPPGGEPIVLSPAEAVRYQSLVRWATAEAAERQI